MDGWMGLFSHLLTHSGGFVSTYLLRTYMMFFFRNCLFLFRSISRMKWLDKNRVVLVLVPGLVLRM